MACSKPSALVRRRLWVQIPPENTDEVSYHRVSESTGYTILIKYIVNGKKFPIKSTTPMQVTSSFIFL